MFKALFLPPCLFVHFKAWQICPEFGKSLRREAKMLGWKSGLRMARQLHNKSRLRPPSPKAPPRPRQSQPTDKARPRFRFNLSPINDPLVAGLAVVFGVPAAVAFALYSPVLYIHKSPADIQSLVGLTCHHSLSIGTKS